MDRYTRLSGGSSFWSNKTLSSNIINQEFWPSKNTFWIKINGVWKRCTTWIKISGIWKQSIPKIKVNGVWN